MLVCNEQLLINMHDMNVKIHILSVLVSGCSTAAVEGALRLTEAGCAGCSQYHASSSTYLMPQKLLKVFTLSFSEGVAPCVYL
jgi:chemotaxis response regulator CheB